MRDISYALRTWRALASNYTSRFQMLNLQWYRAKPVFQNVRYNHRECLVWLRKENCSLLLSYTQVLIVESMGIRGLAYCSNALLMTISPHWKSCFWPFQEYSLHFFNIANDFDSKLDFGNLKKISMCRDKRYSIFQCFWVLKPLLKKFDSQELFAEFSKSLFFIF